ARVMMNFGFQKLILINPRMPLASPEIEIVARRGIQIVNHADLRFSSLKELREDFDLLVGTTARVGSDYNLNRVALTPEEAFTKELYGDSIGIVFGREQYGLKNEEINICDLLVCIPSNEEYPVLNLSHAISIVLYTIQYSLFSNENQNILKKPKHRVASINEREQLKTYFNQLIKEVNYHPEKQHIASQAFSNILSRGYVSGREVTILMGVLKWINFQMKKDSSEEKE
ncbi:MAG: TrmJ/YjtD family RNA methyltransferase, partial [Candidatus Heimdallarchaeota archaeon]|nr:TrmJ/YjtD family RNA methyltransferase [Candidatus Heimdallarchaeota archaeon]